MALLGTLQALWRPAECLIFAMAADKEHARRYLEDCMEEEVERVRWERGIKT